MNEESKAPVMMRVGKWFGIAEETEFSPDRRAMPSLIESWRARIFPDSSWRDDFAQERWFMSRVAAEYWIKNMLIGLAEAEAEKEASK